MEVEVGAVLARELLDPLDGNFRRVVQVVDDGGPEAAEQELQHGVAPNVAAAAGDEDVVRHDDPNGKEEGKSFAGEKKGRRRKLGNPKKLNLEG